MNRRQRDHTTGSSSHKAQRSSRRRYVNETVVIDNEIEIRSAVYQRSSNTAERISTSLSTTTVSLTFPPPSFDDSDFVSSVMVDKLASGSQWALSLLGKSFCFKELELEDDPAFRDRHPSNTFIINTIVSQNWFKKIQMCGRISFPIF